MVKQMNKEKFLEELIKKTNYKKEQCVLICDILERHFIIGKKNKEKFVEDFKNELSLNEEDAENLYEISMEIITTSLKDKLKHPFKSID